MSTVAELDEKYRGSQQENKHGLGSVEVAIIKLYTSKIFLSTVAPSIKLQICMAHYGPNEAPPVCVTDGTTRKRYTLLLYVNSLNIRTEENSWQRLADEEVRICVVPKRSMVLRHSLVTGAAIRSVGRGSYNDEGN